LAVALAPSGAGRCGDGAGAGWLVILIPAFESPAIVAGFDDVAMVGQPIEQGRPIGARRLAREVRPDWLLTKPSSLRGICRTITPSRAWLKFLIAQQMDRKIRCEDEAPRYGTGLPQDYVEAHKWFNLAASATKYEDFREDFRKLRDDLAHKMTASQVEDAQRLAREWKPKPER
jgi:hypothetical protein